MDITFLLNGSPVALSGVDPTMTLLDWLREDRGLTGTKEGCNEGDCGACTVLLDNEPHCSCLLLAGVAAGRKVTTVEGLPEEYVVPFANACDSNGGVQCGFCTPGMAVMGYWLANGGTETGSEPIDMLLAGNICRCTGYNQLHDTFKELPRCR